MNVFLQRYLREMDGLPVPGPGEFPTLRDLERDYIAFLLAVTDFNRSEVSRILRISRSTLYNKMRAYELTEGPGYPESAASAGV